MSDYTPITDWGYKDGLDSGNPEKRIRGTEFDTEFEAIQQAVATKYDSDWSSANLGLVDTLQGLTTAATEDVLWGWDIGTDEPLAYYTMGNGLSFSGTTIEVTDSEVDHDALLNYVADKHVAHADVEVVAGQGLTGGGDITSTKTLNIGEGDGISVAGNSIAADAGNGISVTASGIAAVARPSRGLAVSASGISLAIDNTDTITNVDVDYAADYFVMFDDSTSSPAKVLMSEVVASLDAEDISYDNATSALTADEVQAAIDEVVVNHNILDTYVQDAAPARAYYTTTGYNWNQNAFWDTQHIVYEDDFSAYGVLLNSLADEGWSFTATSDCVIQFSYSGYDQHDAVQFVCTKVDLSEVHVQESAFQVMETTNVNEQSVIAGACNGYRMFTGEVLHVRRANDSGNDYGAFSFNVLPR